jgi:hypothetical protein
MREWRKRKEAEDPGFLDRERAKARARQAERVKILSQDPEWVERERVRKAEMMRSKRADPETRAALNARKRELAQHPEAKRKQADWMRDWRSENSERVAAYQKQWREKNAEKVSEYGKEYMPKYLAREEVQHASRCRHLWSNYKMTIAEFNTLWEHQSGKCAICSIGLLPRGRSSNSVAVDHNHDTGAVRGLLCQLCNRGVGAFKDDPTILKSAAEYLQDKGYYGGNSIGGHNAQ